MDETFETIANPITDLSLKETLERGQSFELLINSAGWKYINSFIENSIQSFANRAIKDPGFASFEEYQLERGKVLGISNMLADIQNDIRILNEQREKAAKSPTK